MSLPALRFSAEIFEHPGDEMTIAVLTSTIPASRAVVEVIQYHLGDGSDYDGSIWYDDRFGTLFEMSSPAPMRCQLGLCFCYEHNS